MEKDEEQGFDVILSQLKTGRWNLIGFITIGYAVFVLSFQLLSGVYEVPQLDFSCNIPDDGELIYEDANFTGVNECAYIDNSTAGNGKMVMCTDWTFDNSTFITSMTSEFSLVCERSSLRASFFYMYTLALMIASVVNGFLSDRFGRRCIACLGGVMFVVFANVIAWLPNYATVLAARFLMAVCHAFLMLPGIILVMETCEPRHRSLVQNGVIIPYSAGVVILGGLGYLFRRWRQLQMIISLPSLLLLPALWFLEESPRWLAVRGRHSKALQVLRRAERLNKVKLPPDEELLAHMRKIYSKGINEEKMASKDIPKNAIMEYLQETWMLIKTLEVCKRLLLLSTVYVMTTVIFFGILLAARRLNADPYIYMIFNGLAEIPGYFIAFPVMKYVGRRTPISVGYLLCAVSIFSTILLKKIGIGWLILYVSMAGKFCLSAIMQILMLYSTELFPTEMRIRAFGLCSFIGRLGSFLGVYVSENLGATYPLVSTTLFGVSSLAAAVLILFLPETFQKSLPETTRDICKPHLEPEPTALLDSGKKPTEDHSEETPVPQFSSPCITNK